MATQAIWKIVNKPVNKDKGGLCASPSNVCFAHREMWVHEEKQKQKQRMTYIINLVSEDNIGAIDQESKHRPRTLMTYTSDGYPGG